MKVLLCVCSKYGVILLHEYLVLTIADSVIGKAIICLFWCVKFKYLKNNKNYNDYK